MTAEIIRFAPEGAPGYLDPDETRKAIVEAMKRRSANGDWREYYIRLMDRLIESADSGDPRAFSLVMERMSGRVPIVNHVTVKAMPVALAPDAEQIRQRYEEHRRKIMNKTPPKLTS